MTQKDLLIKNGYIKVNDFYYQKKLSNNQFNIYSNIYMRKDKVIFTHCDISFECILDSEREMKVLKYTMSLCWRKHFELLEELKKCQEKNFIR